MHIGILAVYQYYKAHINALFYIPNHTPYLNVTTTFLTVNK